MYNINYKNIKKGYGFYIPFLILGLIFVLLLSCFAFQGQVRKFFMDSEVKAYNVEIDKIKSSNSTTFKPIYYYIVNDVEYIYSTPFSTNIAVSSMTEKNTIYYKKTNPSSCVSEYETTIHIGYLIFIPFFLIFPIVGIIGIKNIKKNIKRIKWLAENGTLIKGLKYELVNTNKRVNGAPLRAIQVDYELPSGSTIKLTGDDRYDFKTFDADGLVDLLIDSNDPTNYYIDFEIN